MAEIRDGSELLKSIQEAAGERLEVNGDCEDYKDGVMELMSEIETLFHGGEKIAIPAQNYPKEGEWIICPDGTLWARHGGRINAHAYEYPICPQCEEKLAAPLGSPDDSMNVTLKCPGCGTTSRVTRRPMYRTKRDS